MSKRLQFVSPQSYRKIVAHSFRFQNNNVFGFLLGKLNTEAYTVHDYTPVSHNWTSLSPVTEAALEQVIIHAKEKNLSILGAYYASENVSSAEFPDHLKLLMNRLSANNTTGDNEFKPILLTIDPSKLSNIGQEVVLVGYTLTNDQFTPIELSTSVIPASELEKIPGLIKSLDSRSSAPTINDFESSLDNVDDVNWLDQTI